MSESKMGEINRDKNNYLQKMIESFVFIDSSKNNEEAQKKLEKIFNDELIIIHYQETIEFEKSFFMIFDKTIIVIPKASFPQFFQIISKKQEYGSLNFFYTTSITKDEIEETTKKSYEFQDTSFSNKNMPKFLDNCKKAKNKFFKNKGSKILLTAILQLIIIYLLQKSLFRTRIDRLENILELLEIKPQDKKFNIDEFIVLSDLGNGSSGYVTVAYHIETEKLFALKTHMQEIEKSNYEREYNNFKNVYHPFIPRFYGTIQPEQILVMDYIEGKSLLQIKDMNLTIFEKFMIIYEIMFVFRTIHENKYVYRDLNPNNIIIDQNKTAVLIDLDRMVKQNSNYIGTVDFIHMFIAPEIKQEKSFSYEADIYSIGVLIYYIIFEKEPDIQNSEIPPFPYDDIYCSYREIYKKCISIDPRNRYNINELIKRFSRYFSSFCIDSLNDLYVEIYHKLKQIVSPMPILNVHELVKLTTYQKENGDPYTQFLLGKMYMEGEYVQQDIKKAMHYLTLSSDKNSPFAQYLLGEIFYVGKYVRQDINKSIHYLTLSANGNYPQSQFLLGYIFYCGKYVVQDKKKGKYYYMLSAEQNHEGALLHLGQIYYYKFSPNINKAIYYFTLASNQNNGEAQFLLGKIYFNNIDIEKDINKSIYYLTLASNNNHKKAQYFLGQIYYDGVYVAQDINKAMYYLKISASQNDETAEYLLFIIYYDGVYVQRDIKMAIDYLTRSANHDFSEAQYILGDFYYNSNIVQKDIHKAIYYLKLASRHLNYNAIFLLALIYYEGKDVQRDIDKSLKYLTFLSKFNFSDAQCKLGIIYFEGEYIKRDIVKSIYYLTLSSRKNNSIAQFFLGVIYYNGLYVKQDIKKAIQYFLLSANQNYVHSQYALGVIYYDGDYVQRDINKSIHYLTLSSNQNHPKAQNMLGFIYHSGKFVQQDIKKSVYYLSLSADQNYLDSQCLLGFIYFMYFNGQYIDKAIHFLTISADKYQKDSCFILATIYSTNVLGEPNFEKAIHYYKNGSSLNEYKCKNNLAIFYANGLINNEKNIQFSIELLEEANKLQKEPILMYNLSLIYFYNVNNLNKCIELLIKVSNEGYFHAFELLCVVLSTRINGNITINKVESEIKNFDNNYSELAKQIFYHIKKHYIERFIEGSNYQYYYNLYKTQSFMYNIDFGIILLSDFFNIKFEKETKQSELTSSFYDGFGLAL